MTASTAIPVGQRIAASLAVRAARSPLLRRVVLHPVVSRPGYWFATGCGLLWGAALGRGHLSRRGGVIVAARLPRWAFGRGGTTIGAVYLTRNTVSDPVLEHEAVHRAQWRHYGLAFIPLYIAAGATASQNRFEVLAGLEKGGYR
ncbi:MAG: hypothetical protein JWQ43_1525 [Glaciihabitans sp.]|nr:hypothetical protein [Glaciihabitans sp.]